MADMSKAEAYAQAMSSGAIGACIRLEKENGLFGYPPELVSVGLRAVDVFCGDAFRASELHNWHLSRPGFRRLLELAV